MVNKDKKIKIAVIGAGILGHSIAQTFAMSGHFVTLTDISHAKLYEAEKNIMNNVFLLNEMGAYKEDSEKVLKRISFFVDLKGAVFDVDLVIEAAPEDLDLKKSIFKSLDNYCQKHTIIASNSSSLIPDDYATQVNRQDKLLGMHFFNPPYLLPLVEVIKGSKTSEETISKIQHLLIETRMMPVIINKQSPGFLGNRLQFALLNEALKIVEEGIASPEDIDKVVKYGFGRRLAISGPFEVFDFGGWDTIAKVQPNITGTSSALIDEKVKNGHLGVKSGKGFYEWDNTKIQTKKKLITNILINIEKNINQ